MTATMETQTDLPLIAHYRTTGAPDEMIDGSGAVRPQWRALLTYLDALPSAARAACFARGEQYLRDAGVFYRHYGKGDLGKRDWPLSHIPVILGESDWEALAAGLIQRADLLEAVMADVYGDNNLVKSGDLPAEFLASNQHWLRPLVGVRPPSGHFLHFIAMDLGRGPDGRWWVLGDRTEAPSGAGFALETRVATSRIFSDIYRQANVHRLAGFFSAFKEALTGLTAPGTDRPGLLTPGRFNDTYYEQAYIARYLGLPLLEGEDLEVDGIALMVRTIAGPRPVSVLWRRLDSDWCDPLELNEHSHLGTPGLVEAIRAGRVSMVNALGAGILETQGFLAFLPRLCERLTGQRLSVPNVATWWCGQEAEYRYVRDNADSLIISRVTANRLPLEQEGQALDMPPVQDPAFLPWLERERHQLVGQEVVTLSTTPVWHDGALVARPMVLRVFLARTDAGWQVMPGGFARVSQSREPGGIAMRNGASVADVWVVANHTVPEPSLLKREGTAFIRANSGLLPARAADNLFWLGRYVERSEGALRLLRAYHGRLAEVGPGKSPLLTRLEAIFAGYGIKLGAVLPNAVSNTVASAVFSASKIRDRFSLDGWSALVDLQSSMAQLAETMKPGDDAARGISVLIRKLTGFSGLVNDNMYRASGWHFLRLGQAVERAIAMADLLAALTGPAAPDGALDVLVEVGDSAITHRRRYVAISRASVCDLLLLDALNPRSVLFELDRMNEHARALSAIGRAEPSARLARLLDDLRQDIAAQNANAITPAWLSNLGRRIASLSALVSEAYIG
ncbi:MAG: circularly permuted type 2 ATP-grasp protein [Proteobacteria bacterium]|nr:circularly permuted type 2 ATP-grasp protein [Pseudomonadota bacterium]